MAAAPPVHALWAYQAHAATRERRHKRSHPPPGAPADEYSSDLEEERSDEAAEQPDGVLNPDGARGSSSASGTMQQDASSLVEQAEDRRWLRSTNVVARAGSTQQTAELRTQHRLRQEARRAARGQHLPWRGETAENARLLRVIKGLPPVGSCADADQLSDWEEALESAVRTSLIRAKLTLQKLQRVRYGERDIVQIGRRRTLLEEELSHDEDELHRHLAFAAPPPAADASYPSDTFSMGAAQVGSDPWARDAADVADEAALWDDEDASLPASASASASASIGSIPMPRRRPRRSVPQRWVPQGAPAAAAAALDNFARQYAETDINGTPIADDDDRDLDGDVEDMDAE